MFIQPQAMFLCLRLLVLVFLGDSGLESVATPKSCPTTCVTPQPLGWSFPAPVGTKWPMETAEMH